MHPSTPLDNHDDDDHDLACPICVAYGKGGMSRFDLIMAHSGRWAYAGPLLGCLLGAIAGVYVGLA